MDYTIGQIFYTEPNEEVNDWCSKNGCHIWQITIDDEGTQAWKIFEDQDSIVEKQNNFKEHGPTILIEQDDALCALYEENLSLKSRSDETDDAICSLFEMMLGGEKNG